MNEPIHCVEKDRSNDLINKKVLCANHKKALGYYGVLVGYSEKGKFIVHIDVFDKKYICEWIVSY